MKAVSTNIAISSRSPHHEEDQDDRLYSVSMQSNDALCMATMSNEYPHTNDRICDMVTSPCSNEKSLLSELSPHMSIDSPFPQEQSLFSELCSHLNEAKGFGTDAGDLEDDPFTESHKRTHRLESQMVNTFLFYSKHMEVLFFIFLLALLYCLEGALFIHKVRVSFIIILLFKIKLKIYYFF